MTLEKYYRDALEWAEFKRKYERRPLQGKPAACEFEGVQYPTVAACCRAVGHSRYWLRKRGLIVLKK